MNHFVTEMCTCVHISVTKSLKSYKIVEELLSNNFMDKSQEFTESINHELNKIQQEKR